MIDLLYKAVLMISLKAMKTTLDLRKASGGLSERHEDDPVPSSMESSQRTESFPSFGHDQETFGHDIDSVMA